MAINKVSKQQTNLEETIQSISRLRKGFFLIYRILLVYLLINLIGSIFRKTIGTETLFIIAFLFIVSSIIYAVSLIFEIFLKTDLVISNIKGVPVKEKGFGKITTEYGSIKFSKFNPSIVLIKRNGKSIIFNIDKKGIKSPINTLIAELSGIESFGDNHA